MLRNFVFLLFKLLLCFNLQSQTSLNLEDIMKGEDFVGYLPEETTWTIDNTMIVFKWRKSEKDSIKKYYMYDLTGDSISLADIETLQKVPSRNITWSTDMTLAAWSKQGDIFLWEKKQKKLKRLTHTIDGETLIGFSQDEQSLFFRQGDNIFSINLLDFSIVQHSNFRKGKENLPTDLQGAEKWLEDDNLALFEVLSRKKSTSSAQKEYNKTLEVKYPRAIWYGDLRLDNQTVSPDGKYLTYRLMKSKPGKSTDVPDYMNTNGYTANLRAREKVGTGSTEYSSFVYDTERDTIIKMDISDLPGIRTKPAFLNDYHKDTTSYSPEFKEPKSVIIHGPFYSKNGKAFVDVKSLDNKDRWLAMIDLTTGKLKCFDHQHDEAWIGGPGISSWNGIPGNVGWLSDQKRIYFQSEKTGYSQLYTYDTEKSEITALTKGNFEILSTSTSSDGSKLFITANAEGPHQQHFYHLSLDSGVMTKITSDIGAHEVSMSYDESNLAVRYSFSNKPWEIYLMKNDQNAEMKRITKSTKEAFDKYPWRVPEIVWFDAQDGVKVPARLYKSKSKANKAAVIFVHGAGYLQNVHQWWSSYFREYMFHNFLVDRGYTVLDIDFRASSGYGRDWRTAIYRHMGGKDLSDQVDGARYLIKNHGIDKNKIGIYGGSYGGFITLMGMFKHPEVFKCGAALRSVTDWAHYNHGYTSNILNTPMEDPDSYYKSSPIYFADGLKGNLLMLHGVVDVNVQIQDVIRLSQKLMELGKENWELAVYPVEDHGFTEWESWLDEYKRIFKLFEKNLR